MFVGASLYNLREENQLDATEWFIALVICSTCFGHFYAHHQELEIILVLLPHMVCNALVAGGRRSGAGQQAMCPGWGKLCESHNFPHPGRVALRNDSLTTLFKSSLYLFALTNKASI